MKCVRPILVHLLVTWQIQDEQKYSASMLEGKSSKVQVQSHYLVQLPLEICEMVTDKRPKLFFVEPRATGTTACILFCSDWPYGLTLFIDGYSFHSVLDA